MAQLLVYIRKGADSRFIDWPEKSQNLVWIFSFKAGFFHYQTMIRLASNLYIGGKREESKRGLQNKTGPLVEDDGSFMCRHCKV